MRNLQDEEASKENKLHAVCHWQVMLADCKAKKLRQTCRTKSLLFTPQEEDELPKRNEKLCSIFEAKQTTNNQNILRNEENV